MFSRHLRSIATPICVVWILLFSTHFGFAVEPVNSKLDVRATRAAYDDELDKVRALSAGSIDPCLNAIYIAAVDGDVRQALLRHLLNPNEVFKKVDCLDKPSIPEYEHVLFDFDCRPGIFCLIDPNVLVTVDVVNRQVVNIADPYIPSRVSATSRTKDSSRDVDNEIALVGTNYQFDNEDGKNPEIKVKLGETVRVTLTSGGGTHDWTLVYIENGEEVVWVDTPNTNGPAVSTGVFTADRLGKFTYYCDVGTHRRRGMEGKLKFIVESPDEGDGE